MIGMDLLVDPDTRQQGIRHVGREALHRTDEGVTKGDPDGAAIDRTEEGSCHHERRGAAEDDPEQSQGARHRSPFR